MLRRCFLLLALLCLATGCQSSSLPQSTPTTATEIPPPASPDLPAPTETSLPMPSPTGPDPRQFTVRIQKASLWDAPENESRYWHLQTELILGEKAIVLERQGDWSRVAAVEQPSSKDPRGYPGWVRTENLAPGWPSASSHYAVVMKPTSLLRDEPDGTPRLEIFLDTRLPVETTLAGWVQVRLPDGGSGWLPSDDVRLAEDWSAPVPTEGLFALAESLVGAPYRWGGTTPDALDCSGFTYRVFHAYGITLMRDANDLASGGAAVVRTDLKKGDLIFTSETSGGAISHVAMFWGNGTILDSSGDRGAALRPLAELLASNVWVTARRYLP